MKKLNIKGFAHWIVPALVVVVIGGIGTYLVVGSNAATTSYGNPFNGKSICENTHYNRLWKNGTCTKTCKYAGYRLVTVAYPGYDYCIKIVKTARCILSAPLSAPANTTFVMSLTINNTGNTAFSTKYEVRSTSTFKPSSGNQATVNFYKTYTTGTIYPKKAAIQQIPVSQSKDIATVTYTVKSLVSPSYSCAATININ